MVGSPYQRPENLADDMLFLAKLNPQMVGIGPFIPHHETPFARMPGGTAELTVYMLGLIRLLLPRVLLPGYDSSRNDRRRRQGKGHSRRSQCYHAEPLSGTGQGEIPAVRQQTLYRRRGRGKPESSQGNEWKRSVTISRSAAATH